MEHTHVELNSCNGNYIAQECKSCPFLTYHPGQASTVQQHCARRKYFGPKQCCFVVREELQMVYLSNERVVLALNLHVQYICIFGSSYLDSVYLGWPTHHLYHNSLYIHPLAKQDMDSHCCAQSVKAGATSGLACKNHDAISSRL